MHVFPGNYEDYLYRKQKGSQPQAEEPNPTLTPPVTTAVADGNGRSSEPPPAIRLKKLNPHKLRQMQDRLQELEDNITRAENAIAEYENASLTFVSPQETIRITNLLQQRRRELAELLSQWEEISQVKAWHVRYRVHQSGVRASENRRWRPEDDVR